jgi:pimeloyl-ACP methyl ester carboxylesterase
MSLPMPADLPTVLLVHGGLWEAMNAEWFWVRPGIVAALRGRGLAVLAPDRLARPSSWDEDAAHLATALPAGPVVLVAGSNGCSAAVRLAVTHPESVRALLLAWPATAGNARVDELTLAGMTSQGAPGPVVESLLAGGALRGVVDGELAALRAPVAVLPSVPENAFHRRHTVDTLLRTVPSAVELPGCPEPPRSDFAPHLASFCEAVAAFTAIHG